MKKLIKNEGIKISIVTIVINFILFVFKFITGIFGHSNAMVSDAVHSLSDVFTTILVIIGIILASKEADRNHPYGHERIESVFGIILAFLLLTTGLSIGFVGIKNIINSNSLLIPTIYPLIASLVSIITKEGMFHYTMHYAKKLASPSLKADAWHHRSDALSSIGSFIGILGARIGFKILDPICSILICLLIIKSAIEIFMESINQMLDTSIDEETYDKILKTIKKIDKKVLVKDLKTRLFGSKIYIEAILAIDGNTSLKNAFIIEEKIHDKLEKEFSIIKHCNIKIIPKDC